MSGYEDNGPALLQGADTVWSQHRVQPEHFVRQPNDWSCGPAVLSMLMQCTGRSVPGIDDLARRLVTSESQGTSTWRMEQVLEELVGAKHIECLDGGSVDRLRTLLLEGSAVAIQFREPEQGIGHYGIVEGISSSAIQLCDPYHGASCVLRLENLVWRTQFENPERHGWYLGIR